MDKAKIGKTSHILRYIQNLKRIPVLGSSQENSGPRVWVRAKKPGPTVERILYCEVVVWGQSKKRKEERVQMKEQSTASWGCFKGSEI